MFSTTILVAFLGGVVALVAPCCVSVMLPAYFASSFRSRTRIVAMTLVFAAGVATVIVPIALGAAAISRVISGQHAVVFSVGGVVMVLGGLAILAGWRLRLPMPGRRYRQRAGVGPVYSLGVFSGVASSCCAPVLAGVVAVSAATSSFLPALVVGVAYVFGMVAPLAVLALVWDRRDWGRSRLLTGRRVTLGVRRFRRTVPLADALSGGLLAAMGLLTVVFAVRGPAMPTDGWQVRFSARLGHAAAVVERSLGWLPGWVSAIIILAGLTGLLVQSVRRPGRRAPAEPASQPISEDASRAGSSETSS